MTGPHTLFETRDFTETDGVVRLERHEDSPRYMLWIGGECVWKGDRPIQKTKMPLFLTTCDESYPLRAAEDMWRNTCKQYYAGIEAKVRQLVDSGVALSRLSIRQEPSTSWEYPYRTWVQVDGIDRHEFRLISNPLQQRPV